MAVSVDPIDWLRHQYPELGKIIDEKNKEIARLNQEVRTYRRLYNELLTLYLKDLQKPAQPGSEP